MIQAQLHSFEMRDAESRRQILYAKAHFDTFWLCELVFWPTDLVTQKHHKDRRHGQGAKFSRPSLFLLTVLSSLLWHRWLAGRKSSLTEWVLVGHSDGDLSTARPRCRWLARVSEFHFHLRQLSLQWKSRMVCRSGTDLHKLTWNIDR